MATTVRSHAKINLGLYIGAPRPDGYHALVTVYQTLALHDLVTVSARPASATRLRLTSNDPRVPTDGRNTAWKMVDLALAALGRTAEVEIHIEKRLPVQGGLGAGSANAVAALVGLEAELDGAAGLTAKYLESADCLASGAAAAEPTGANDGFLAQRLTLAARVGSDVPLFLVGGTVLGLDRGQQVAALPDIEPLWCAVATPAVGVSTPQAFRDWDQLCAREGLTPEASAGKLNELSRAYARAFSEPVAKPVRDRRPGAGSSGVLVCGEDLAGPQESALVRTGISSWIQNDFERVVFAQQPSLAEIKRLLASPDHPEAASSCLAAMLSGSGSALFGLYCTRREAEAARLRVAAAGVESRLTHTLPRREYWSGMVVQ